VAAVGTDGDRESGSPEWRAFLGEVTDALRCDAAGALSARLCEAVLRLLPVTGASLSLLGDESPFATLHATDDVARRLAQIQHSLGEGPCLAAVRAGAPVLAADLHEGRDRQRWPLFALQAAEAGARSVFSLPLGESVGVIGTLDLYDLVPRTLDEDALGTAMHAAEAIAWALATHHERSHDDLSAGTASGVAWWEKAEISYEEVYKAVGMLMVRFGVTADEAMARLRARAFSLDRSLTEVAWSVVHREDDFDVFD
jgi:hypothetical protein